jgi:hypothetical protein
MSAIITDALNNLSEALLKAIDESIEVSSEVERAAFKRWVIQTDWFRDTSLEISEAIVLAMKSYSHGGSVGRFFAGNWNSTFGSAIDRLLKNLGSMTPDLPRLIGELESIEIDGKKPFNSEGAFHDVREKYEAKIDELAEKIMNGNNFANLDWQLCRYDAIQEYLDKGAADPTKYESFGMGKY